MHELMLEYTTRRIYSASIASGLLIQLLSKLCRSIRLGEGHDGHRPDEIISYINAHMCEKLTYESLGRIFSYHPNHINRIITRVTGTPLHQYLLRLRIEKAYSMLCDERKPVSEVADLCGFPDAMSFSKRFRLETGFTPSEVRRRGSS
jgi:AraC-like DNA-binding protein